MVELQWNKISAHEMIDYSLFVPLQMRYDVWHNFAYCLLNL